MTKLLFSALLISLVCISCESKKDVAKKTENNSVNVINTSDVSLKYRLIVSFISKGTGTDSDKRTAFLAYVESHPKKPTYKTVIWGREGESDYCFNLSELTDMKDLNAFIAEVKKIIGTTDRVYITENAECLHKGR